MIQIGITGQSGFIGTHLYSFFDQKEGLDCIPFLDAYFDDDTRLDRFTSKCDVIFHLASIHRDPDPKKLYEGNMVLTDKLLASCDRTKRCKRLVFTSSIQESGSGAYGKSKKANRLKIENWAAQGDRSAVSLILPNVFGPGAKAFHTSFIATFSYQLWHGEEPVVIEDREVGLVFIGDLLAFLYRATGGKETETISVPVSKTLKVSDVLRLLKQFREDIQEGKDGSHEDPFPENLFQTFYSYRRQ